MNYTLIEDVHIEKGKNFSSFLIIGA